MNGFVRQLVVLSVVWPLCELLLPTKQHMVRMTAGVLVMAALVSAMGNMLRMPHAPVVLPTVAQTVTDSSEGSYARAALKSLAEQAQTVCERLCARAGYDVRAGVRLRVDGSLDGIVLHVMGPLPQTTPTVAAERLPALVAQHFETDEEKVSLVLSGTDGA